jgi:hypothetical protein
MSFVKKHWFGVALGALVVVGGSFIAANAMSSTPSPQQISLTQAQSQPEASAAPKAGGVRGRRLVHGDLVVQGKDGLRSVRVDHGILQSVDGSTLHLKEADGSTVDIATTEQTRFRRDKQPAKITDLKGGDNVWTMRVKNGESYVTMRVRAVSAQQPAA